MTLPSPQNPSRKISAKWIVLILLPFFAVGIFVLTLGSVHTSLLCEQATKTCELRESYFFENAPRVQRFAQSDIQRAELQKAYFTGKSIRPPKVVELVFANGQRYPTVDYVYESMAQEKIAAFNAYLNDVSIPQIRLETPPSYQQILLSHGPTLLLTLVIGAGVWAYRRRRKGRG